MSRDLRRELAIAMARADGHAVVGLDDIGPDEQGDVPPSISVDGALVMFAPMLDGILPIIVREVEAALTAARPVIERETREACAKVAEELQFARGTLSSWINVNESPMQATRRHIAAAIRIQP